MPLVQTRGAASAQGFGEFAQVTAVNYIEDVFSTYLYTGNDGTLPIVNGIDLSTKGGLVWIKSRTYGGGGNHILTDTVRGINSILYSNTTNSAFTASGENIEHFDTTGFTLGYGYAGYSNYSGSNNVSWTFREQAKFFDVVTYTGNATNRTIAHSLGSVPGCIIVKRTDTTADWAVYHRSLANTDYLTLNTTAAAATGATRWNSTTATSAVFSVGTDASVNASGGTYVAYLFAHDAGGFGLAGTDNVISCGTFTAGTGSVNLGYEPQWIMFKGLTGSNEWIMFDTMRGWPTEAPNKLLMAESSAAEGDTYVNCQPTATGFNYNFSPSCIYIACRRGPMKVPTLGTSVFSPQFRLSSTPNFESNFVTDANLYQYRPGGANSKSFESRLTDGYKLEPNTTAAESGGIFGGQWDYMNGIGDGQSASTDVISYMFRRAPGFFDEVCYTGTGSGQVINHNLGVTPELLIFKARNNYASSGYEYWYTNAPNTTYALALNLDVGESYTKISSSNSTTVSLGSSNNYVLTNQTYVAYLFATCAGVSKVFSYTGNGSSQTINCGFTAGSRFVLIKRTDSTGDWYVWDSARGIVAGNDPHLSLNTTAAEVTTDDSVDTDSTGFIVNQVAATNVNVSSATYIGLAVA